METEKRYFVEGLFIIGLSIAAVLFAVWLVSTGQRDDVTYRIRFAESVSGLAIGDPVKMQGVEVGNVSTMALDADDPRIVQVEVRLRKDTPVKTDTKAQLKLKGITGVVFIELEGGSAASKPLLAATQTGQVPEIPYEKSSLATVVDQLPKVIEKFSALEDRAAKVVADVRGVTKQIKDDPSVLLKGPKETPAEKEKEAATAAMARERARH